MATPGSAPRLAARRDAATGRRGEKGSAVRDGGPDGRPRRHSHRQPLVQIDGAVFAGPRDTAAVHRCRRACTTRGDASGGATWCGGPVR
jgi:hypothetical protein